MVMDLRTTIIKIIGNHCLSIQNYILGNWVSLHQTFSCSATHLLVSYEKHFSQYIYFNLNFTV